MPSSLWSIVLTNFYIERQESFMSRLHAGHISKITAMLGELAEDRQGAQHAQHLQVTATWANTCTCSEQRTQVIQSIQFFLKTYTKFTTTRSFGKLTIELDWVGKNIFCIILAVVGEF